MTKKNVDHYTTQLKFGLLAVLVALGLLAGCSAAPATTPPELTMLVERVAIEEFFYDYP